MGVATAVGAWPVCELEAVRWCPVCGSSQRKPMHDERVDGLACGALGRWRLYSCCACGSAFLDPRPTPASIARAHSNHYAPGNPLRALTMDSPSLVQRLRRALANSYTNARYGTRYRPSVSAGYWLAHASTRLRERLDRKFRWLPKPEPGQRLLDVGCGTGEFVARAAEAGWQAFGVDFDREAVAVGRRCGRNVIRGSMESLTQRTGYFHAITLNHVIQQVHSPLEFLRSAHWLLKPGGYLYLDAPNIASLGERPFDRDWRGREPPRHLVLFTPASLSGLLRRAGFRDLCPRPKSPVAVSEFITVTARRGGP